MSFREEIKVKDYFMKDYKKGEILKTFNFMLKRMAATAEISGEVQETKITQIDGNIITVEAKMQDSDEIKIYRCSLQFNQMENEEFTREAKIASPERIGQIVELKEGSTQKEKEEYYQGVVDYWDQKEETENKIEQERKTNYFLERYKKEDLLKTADAMIENSITSGEIEGEVLERKITKIEGTTVTIAIKTKDVEEIIRVYNMNLDFDKMNNITYSKDARIASPTRVSSTVEVQNGISNIEKENYYNKIPDFWDKNIEENQEEK